MNRIDALIPTTEGNFDARCYLLANQDVAKAGVDAFEHFLVHGRKENRLQINPILLSTEGYRREKFSRFKTLLILDKETQNQSFPVSVGTTQYSLDDYDSESSNRTFAPFAQEIEKNPDQVYLDLGCGLRRQVYFNCLYLEIYPSVTADIIVPANCTYPIRDGTLDGVGCFAVLEHTRQPWKVVEEMRRMLKPGGKVWIGWPFLQPVHGYPSHYFNATRQGLRTIFEDNGFKVEEIGTGPHQGPDFTITWVLEGFLKTLPELERERILEMRVGELLKNSANNPFWSKLLSLVDDDARSTFACGNFLIAKKSM